MIQIPKTARLRFLERLARTGSIPLAIDEAGVSRHRLYALRREDAEFAELWDEAVEAGIEALEGEAMRRAIEGVEEPVHYHGKRIDVITRYSDRLLMFLLRAHRPEKYREHVAVEASSDLRDLLREIEQDSQRARIGPA